MRESEGRLAHELRRFSLRRILNAGILIVASLIGLGSFFYPFLLPQRTGQFNAMAHAQDAPLLFVVLVVLCLGAVLSSLASGMMNAKLIAVLGILTAANAVLRGVPGPAGFTLIFLTNHREYNRIGISISRKLKGAVKRNRIKRIFKESFRLNRETYPPDADIVVTVRPDFSLNSPDLITEAVADLLASQSV